VGGEVSLKEIAAQPERARALSRAARKRLIGQARVEVATRILAISVIFDRYNITNRDDLRRAQEQHDAYIAEHAKTGGKIRVLRGAA
jgi:hypothetical protein